MEIKFNTSVQVNSYDVPILKKLSYMQMIVCLGIVRLV